MSKQDRQGVRKPTDLEQKYNFGKSFAEVMGIANDAKTKAEDAADSVKKLDEGLTQDEIFNRLTNNGANQGIYRDENGEIYINASYIRSGVLSSTDGKIKIYFDDGTMPVFNTGISTNGLTIRADAAGTNPILLINAYESTGGTYYGDVLFYSASGKQLMRITENFADTEYTDPVGVTAEYTNQKGDMSVRFDASTQAEIGVKVNGVIVGYLMADANGKSTLYANRINPGKKVLFEGCAAVGSTFIVPDTADYDLFAIQYGTEDTVFTPVVLAYKSAGYVSGSGGYASADYTYTPMFSAEISGNNWTLSGMIEQYTSRSSGSVSTTDYYVRRVIGIV